MQKQRVERQNLKKTQASRQIVEAAARQERFRTGLNGVWDRLRGEHSRIRKLNEREAGQSVFRERMETDALTFTHLDQCKQLDIFKLDVRRGHTRQRQELDRDRMVYLKLPKQISETSTRPVRRRRRRDSSPEP